MQLPKGLTQKEWELLKLITPGIYPKCFSLRGAAKKLNISRQAAYKRLRSFKSKFPKAYENWEKVKVLSQHHRKVLYGEFKRIKKEKKYKNEPWLWRFENYIKSDFANEKKEKYNPIKEKF